MNSVAFNRCQNRFTNKCSGEATVLVLAAERYGTFEEESRERVEELCAHCRNFLSSDKAAFHERKSRPGAVPPRGS